MHGRKPRFPPLLLLVLWPLGLAGCGALDMTDPGRFWPFQKEPFTDQVPGLSTPKERLAALKLLADRAPRAGPEQRERIARELAKAAAQETDPALRAEIIRTLGRYPTETSAAVMRQSLNDAEHEVRIAVCEAWGRLGGQEATEVLSGLVSGDLDQDVRMAAVRALGRTKDPGAKTALARALAEGDPAMQRRAMIALGEVTGRDYGGNAKKWREYLDGGNPEPDRRIWVADRLRDVWGAF